MGSLFYGSDGEPIAIPDALLAHLQFLAAAKLRRGESFTMSWRHPPSDPPGRTTIWIQPAISLRFVFDTAQLHPLDRALLHSYADAAGTTAGLVIDLGADLQPGRDEPSKRSDDAIEAPSTLAHAHAPS